MDKSKTVRFRVTEAERRKLYIISNRYRGGFSEFLRKAIELGQPQDLQEANMEYAESQLPRDSAGQAII